MTTLTSRYITSPETVMDADIRRIKERGFLTYLKKLKQPIYLTPFGMWD